MYVHVDDNKKDILILGQGPAEGLDDTTLTAEKDYSINFTKSRKKFCLNLRYNWANSCLLIVQKFIHLKQKILKLMQFHYAQETFQKSFH